jgi:hypothetical protein
MGLRSDKGQRIFISHIASLFGYVLGFALNKYVSLTQCAPSSFKLQSSFSTFMTVLKYPTKSIAIVITFLYLQKVSEISLI